MVTDHGHIGPNEFGRGHGFQSPRETATFMIWDQACDMRNGWINNPWQIVSTTPTILDQFGIPQPPYMQGAPLTSPVFDGTYVDPGPTCSVRSAPTSPHRAIPIPSSIKSGRAHRRGHDSLPGYDPIQSIVDAVPQFLQLPVSWVGAGVYQTLNIPAQIFVRLTGVTGNEIIPPVLNPFI